MGTRVGPGGSVGRQRGRRRGRLAGLGRALGHVLQLGGGAAAGGGAAVGAGTVVGLGRTTRAPGRPRRGASARPRARAGRALGPGATPRPAGENDSPSLKKTFFWSKSLKWH